MLYSHGCRKLLKKLIHTIYINIKKIVDNLLHQHILFAIRLIFTQCLSVLYLNIQFACVSDKNLSYTI